MDSTAAGRPQRLRDDEISLGELIIGVLRFYQRYGRLLVIPSLVLAISCAWWISGRPLYDVSAMLEVPDASLEEWRQSQSFLWDQRWVAHTFGDLDGQTAPIQLKRLALTPVFWTNTVRYRSALNKDDIRDVPVAEVQKTRSLGLDLRLRVKDENQAFQTFELLTRHVRQALLANSLISLTRDGQQALARKPLLNLELLQTDFQIGQERQRIEDMRQLLERYPELRQMENTTVVSVSDGGGKYLAPLAQIVALETTVSELQARSRKTRHELEKLDWTAQLLTGMDQAIRNASSGDAIIGKLRENRARLLADHPQLSSGAQEVVQDMDLKLALADARQQAIGIKTRSALSSKPILARRPFMIGLLVFGVVFAGLSTLLAVHTWLSREAEVLGWLPRPLRRWLIVEVPL
ncbi:hypothetical protein SAMN05216593_101552 [Pseudomonas asturiensis]|uniref:Chain length determinant protein n=1 Tax=Pseudomonas asturiensis TaxID=1190415 RepID=A0A1M7JU12_9PSED|nr:hypothetical protein [Pseudomonas asturiensis]SHM56532.1 hypothetical protein SAMN05216593_101552 [Pseudomonas asturiensis]